MTNEQKRIRLFYANVVALEILIRNQFVSLQPIQWVILMMTIEREMSRTEYSIGLYKILLKN